MRKPGESRHRKQINLFLSAYDGKIYMYFYIRYIHLSMKMTQTINALAMYPLMCP